MADGEPFQRVRFAGDERFFLCRAPSLDLSFTPSRGFARGVLLREYQRHGPPLAGVASSSPLVVHGDAAVDVGCGPHVQRSIDASHEIHEGHPTTMHLISDEIKVEVGRSLPRWIRLAAE